MTETLLRSGEREWKEWEGDKKYIYLKNKNILNIIQSHHNLTGANMFLKDITFITFIHLYEKNELWFDWNQSKYIYFPNMLCHFALTLLIREVTVQNGSLLCNAAPCWFFQTHKCFQRQYFAHYALIFRFLINHKCLICYLSGPKSVAGPTWKPKQMVGTTLNIEAQEVTLEK